MEEGKSVISLLDAEQAVCLHNHVHFSKGRATPMNLLKLVRPCIRLKLLTAMLWQPWQPINYQLNRDAYVALQEVIRQHVLPILPEPVTCIPDAYWQGWSPAIAALAAARKLDARNAVAVRLTVQRCHRVLQKLLEAAVGGCQQQQVQQQAVVPGPPQQVNCFEILMNLCWLQVDATPRQASVENVMQRSKSRCTSDAVLQWQGMRCSTQPHDQG